MTLRRSHCRRQRMAGGGSAVRSEILTAALIRAVSIFAVYLHVYVVDHPAVQLAQMVLSFD